MPIPAARGHGCGPWSSCPAWLASPSLGRRHEGRVRVEAQRGLQRGVRRAPLERGLVVQPLHARHRRQLPPRSPPGQASGLARAIGVQRQRVPARAGAQIALEVCAMPAQLPACIRGALRGRIRAQRATVATVAANAWSRARALVEARRSRRRGFEAPPDFFLFFIFIS